MVKKFFTNILHSPRFLLTLLGINSTILLIFVLYYRELSLKVNDLITAANTSSVLLKDIKPTLDIVTSEINNKESPTLPPAQEVTSYKVKTLEQNLDEMLDEYPILVFLYGFVMTGLGLIIGYNAWFYFNTYTYEPSLLEKAADDFFAKSFDIEKERRRLGDLWVDYMEKFIREPDTDLRNHPIWGKHPEQPFYTKLDDGRIIFKTNRANIIIK